MKKTILLIISALVIASGCGSGADYLRNKKDEPFLQEVENKYEKAMKLFERKSYEEAASELDDLLPQAKNREQREKVMFLLAESDFYLEYNDDADSLYTKYLNEFPDTKRFNEVLPHMFDVGFRFINGAKQSLLGLYILSAEHKGIEIVRSLLKQFPYASESEKNHLKLVGYFLKQKDYEELRKEYDLFIQVYPGSDSVPLASFRIADSYLAEYQGPEYDPADIILAEKLFKRFLEKYPSSDLASQAQKKLVQIYSYKAHRDFLVADYYLRTGSKSSARIAFQNIINDYQGTEWAEKAQKIIPTIIFPSDNPIGTSSNPEKVKMPLGKD
jgi:outer membrane protein assembly factor BamD (BamD/ComL family)